MGWEVGGSFKREGTYVYLWLLHIDTWQKPTQYYKAIILQLKINKLEKTLQSALCMLGSTPTDSAHCGSCNTIVFSK